MEDHHLHVHLRSRIQKLLGALLAAGLLFGTLAIPASANTAGFSVYPQIPENQKEGSGYFNLSMTPGQEQELRIAVENQEDQEITISIEVYTAITNSNGLISYSETGVSDSSLPYSFADLATVLTPNLTVGPHDTAEAVVSVKMPEKEFDGIILGGIRTLKALTQDELTQAETVAHQYSYVIAAMLSENDNPVDVEFQPGGVTTELVNQRAAIVTEIRNVKPAMVKGVEILNQIVSAESGEVVMEASLLSAEFAPNSVLRIQQVDEEGTGLVAGAYLSRTQINYNGVQWSDDSVFTIEPSAAQELNRSALNQQEGSLIFRGRNASGGGLPMLPLIGAGVVLLLLAAFLIAKFIRKSREEQREIERQMKAIFDMQKDNQ